MGDDILKSPIDGREISVRDMSRRELRKLHYTEEIKMAEMIFSFKPFSKERKELLNNGYDFVENLKLRYERTGNGSFGASPATVKLVRDVVEKRKEKGNKQQIIYEAGVGMGYAVKELATIPDVKFWGCDVALLPNVKEMIQENPELRIRENTLYDDLEKIRDDFIDVFYADNVIEHLIPDEALFILKRLNKKMKRGGQLIWIIPNRYLGPHDVSKYYLPKGEKATGFHFMEMSYQETVKLAIRCGFKPKWIVKRTGRKFYIEKDPLYLKNFTRILQEAIIGKLDSIIRSELFFRDVYNCYIFEK